jgi:hypothetical protein
MDEEKKTTGKATRQKISGERVSIIETRAQVEARASEVFPASEDYQHVATGVSPSEPDQVQSVSSPPGDDGDGLESGSPRSFSSEIQRKDLKENFSDSGVDEKVSERVSEGADVVASTSGSGQALVSAGEKNSEDQTSLKDLGRGLQGLMKAIGETNSALRQSMEDTAIRLDLHAHRLDELVVIQRRTDDRVDALVRARNAEVLQGNALGTGKEEACEATSSPAHPATPFWTKSGVTLSNHRPDGLVKQDPGEGERSAPMATVVPPPAGVGPTVITLRSRNDEIVLEVVLPNRTKPEKDQSLDRSKLKNLLPFLDLSVRASVKERLTKFVVFCRAFARLVAEDGIRRKIY